MKNDCSIDFFKNSPFRIQHTYFTEFSIGQGPLKPLFKYDVKLGCVTSKFSSKSIADKAIYTKTNMNNNWNVNFISR